jgi:hypothetical protein
MVNELYFGKNFEEKLRDKFAKTFMLLSGC